jgi:plasmid stabilization system protein ParE
MGERLNELEEQDAFNALADDDPRADIVAQLRSLVAVWAEGGDGECAAASDLRSVIHHIEGGGSASMHDWERAGYERAREAVSRATDRIDELEALFQQTHGCHFSWVQAGKAWQDWAATLLGSLGQQPEGGQHGDEAARTLIEGMLSSGVLRSARLGEAVTEWRSRCPCACAQCKSLDEALRDAEVGDV